LYLYRVLQVDKMMTFKDQVSVGLQPQCTADGHAAANPMPGEGCARPSRFFCRIDAYLPALPDNETRRIFLDRQIEGWERRYSRFLATDGASEPAADPADPPQAADFLLTIEGLASRRGLFASITGEMRMLDTMRQKRLERAILSLLVAADQRCPAIIGQAHLLYHAGGMRPNGQQALRQLKSDAQDLLAAIANAEAEMHAVAPQPRRDPSSA
jgi:hypothetical protein